MNQPGNAGGDGEDYSIVLQGPQDIGLETANQDTVEVDTSGGNGSAATASDDWYSGGQGGKGGDVGITLDSPTAPTGQYYDSAIEALGAGASAFRETSTGGSGGGGSQAAVDGPGGTGGRGGDGGALGLTINSIAGHPERTLIWGGAAAVNLQTQGGAGGQGGDAGGGKGPDGGAAGKGGSITANLSGDIFGETGVLAVSRGGTGGQGGGSADPGLSNGGGGGAAGDGGDVTISLASGSAKANAPGALGEGGVGQFSSTDDTSFVPADMSVTSGAILAESHGGVGGHGGTANGIFADGGSGAIGGAGGDVTVSLLSSGNPDAYSWTYADRPAVIGATGYNTVGVLALSAGGDGGTGDSGGGVYSNNGGAGGVGGDAGAAQIVVGNDGSQQYPLIATSGDNSDALVAISVGGGGGYGGSVKTEGSDGFTVSLGGRGGNGGDGNLAYVANGYYDAPPTDGGPQLFHNPDVISTTGDRSYGIVVQSIGGGGGRGGDAYSGVASGGVPAGSVAIGGEGGKGGSGALASATNFGLIGTTGNQSVGVFAQSVGGGGGAGGGAIGQSEGTFVTAAIAVGGKGGVGGSGDEADIYNLGQVQTQGSNAHAVFAQSVGGGGGVGGTALAETLALQPPDTPSLTFNLALGGSGGAAGDGGAVHVLNTDLLQTQGANSYGIFAQSVGGGGGAGGDGSALSTALNQSTVTMTVGVGGKGSGGGAGGDVNVWNSGLITTTNENSSGIFAQSVGGGGGDGGFGSTNQGAYDGGKWTLNTAVGGDGGKGGAGGDVTVANYVSQDPTLGDTFDDTSGFPDRQINGWGSILTFGDLAHGIFAQSVGGGGGNGGDATAKGGNGDIVINVAIGGQGGAGGDGGNVSVRNGMGGIMTNGAQAFGVFGQSVGGGGGTGGAAATGSGNDPQYTLPEQAANSLFQGLPGSDPEQAADTIWDMKDNFRGAWNARDKLDKLSDLYKQINTDPGSVNLKDVAATINVDIGAGAAGGGGAGGNGGNVDVDSMGTIVTNGAMSFGMFGQSVGGGGGVGGGSAPATSNDLVDSAGIAASIAIGGQGGKGGDSGLVQLTNEVGGVIETSGDVAFGMFAQTIGAGGGVGGATLPNAVPTAGLSISLGGGSGANGSAKEARIDDSGMVTTYGNQAIGVVAQSVGGGGGLAALMGAVVDPSTGLLESSTQSLPDLPAANGAVTLNSDFATESKTNAGGAATVNVNAGAITTSGINAFGVLAQSVGGGGGLIIVDKNTTLTPNNLAPAEANFNAVGQNNGGDVTVTIGANAAIATSGSGAAGVVAQSLGGGGAIVNGLNGVNFATPAVITDVDRWEWGYGGNVRVDNSGDITVTGDFAPGIFAQAASGGAGVIGNDSGTGHVFHGGLGEDDASFCNGTSMDDRGNCGGDVQVALHAGTVKVSGLASWGAVLLSEDVSQRVVENDNPADMSRAVMTIDQGAEIQATGKAAGAILINGSGLSEVDNSGTIDGGAGYAIYAVNGRSYKVVNSASGVIRGSFSAHCSGTCNDVGSAAALGSVENQGFIQAGDTLDLGGGQLVNHGTVSIGESGKVAKTELTGDFLQGPDGVLLADYDAKTGAADKLTVGGKATIGGQVKLAANVVAKADPVTILSAAGGVTLASAPAVAALGASKPFSDDLTVSGNDLQVQTNAHFTDAATGLGKNQQAVGAHLQEVWDSGASLEKGFAGLHATNEDATAYAQALNSLAGQSLGAIDAVRHRTSQTFVSNMLDRCPDGVDSNGRCVWGRVSGTHTNQSTTQDALGYKVDGQAVQLGASAPVGEKLSLSGSFGYGQDNLKGDGGSKVKGQELRAGAMLTYKTGPWELSGGLDAGHGSYDSTRTVAIGGATLTATAKPKTWDVGAHLRAAYDHPIGKDWSVKPFVDLNAVYAHSQAYTETGAADLNLKVDQDNDTVLSARTGVELSGELKVGKDKGLTLRPFATASVEALNNSDWAAKARFVDQDGTTGFKASTPLPSVLGEVAIGAELAKGDRWSLKAQYGADLGKNFTSQTGAVRLAVKF